MSLQVEKKPSFSTLAPVPDWEELQEKQGRMLVRADPKTICFHSNGELCLDTIYRARQGKPVTLQTAVKISHAQGNFDYIALLLEQCGILLTRVQQYSVDTQNLGARLMTLTGTALKVCGRLEQGEVMTDEEMRELEQVGEAIKATIDTMIQTAREKRAERDAQ